MNGKQSWAGIVPSPRVFAQLDQEEISVLALLAWSTATNRPVTSLDVAALPDRNGNPLGLEEARTITGTLTNLKIASVLGMNNDRPLSIFLGGFQPRAALAQHTRPSYSGRDSGPHPQTRRPREGEQFTRPQSREVQSGPPRAVTRKPAGAPRPKRPSRGPVVDEGQLIENKTKELPQLRTTDRTPDFVEAAAQQLREAQARVENGEFGDDLVRAAKERLRILEARVELYERWLNQEPDHDVLGKFLARKRKAVPELRYQLERSYVKQEELNAEKAAEEQTG